MNLESLLVIFGFVTGVFGVLFFILGGQAAEIRQLKNDYHAALQACHPKKKV